MATEWQLTCASPHEWRVKKMRLEKKTLLEQNSIRNFFFGSFKEGARHVLCVSKENVEAFN